MFSAEITPTHRFTLVSANLFRLVLVTALLVPLAACGGRRTASRESARPTVSSGLSGSDLSGQDASLRNTLEACARHGQADFPAAGLNYNAQRVLRKICAAPGTDAGLVQMAAEQLTRTKFSFAQVNAYEALAAMPGFSGGHVLPGLDAVSTLSFASSATFRNFAAMRGAAADQGLAIIPDLNAASPRANEAARAWFGIRGMDVETAMQGLPGLSDMGDKQARAFIAYAETPGMDPQTAIQGMDHLHRLDTVNLANARHLFKAGEVSGQEALSWLKNYFSQPVSRQEAIYDGLGTAQKTALLKGLYDGGEDAIWKINDLHAVTDSNGYEYSNARLNGMSAADLTYLFNRLDPVTRSRFSGQFAAGNRVGALRQATSAARVQAARDLTTANLYVVMAQGSELYDSSFRDIIVPVMKERIAQKNGGDLLRFLRHIDPENRYVSDFISSTAQKGKLTEFFPDDFVRQQEILTLVAGSAFKDPDSVLLFSATLSHLLKMLTPEARSHLIGLMERETRGPNSTTATLVRVVLQYYAQSYPELLGTGDRLRISRLLVQQGSVNLDRYQATPFAEWQQDGKIGSLSMYHPDDDGRQSFASNAALLMKAGYRLQASPEYSIGGTCDVSGGIDGMFSIMRRRHCAISFVKNVGGIRIVNTQFVYSGKDNQKELLKRFILSGDEMLAQRGHSYWRSEQIIEPLEELLKEELITAADLRRKQRFLSLGSCGGVKVYTTLTRLFEGSVDLLASIGTGLAMINDPYNKSFCEIAAGNAPHITWRQVAEQTAWIFASGRGQDYLQPGSLTAILHKILDESGVRGNIGRQDAAQRRQQERRWLPWGGGRDRQQSRQEAAGLEQARAERYRQPPAQRPARQEQYRQQMQRQWSRSDGPVYIPQAERERMRQEMRRIRQEEGAY